MAWLLPWSLGEQAHWQSPQSRRTEGRICYYRTEFLLELPLQGVLMWPA